LVCKNVVMEYGVLLVGSVRGNVAIPVFVAIPV
jgi:hypothetical protein